MKIVKSISYIIFALMITTQGFAEQNSCEGLFSERAPILAESGRSTLISQEVVAVDSKISETIKAMNASFSQPTPIVKRVMLKALSARIDSLTNLLARFYVHSDPFSYISEGVMPQVRLWIKTGIKTFKKTLKSG